MKRARAPVAHVRPLASTFGRRRPRDAAVSHREPPIAVAARGAESSSRDEDSNPRYSTTVRDTSMLQSRLMELRRSWLGLEVALIATRAGVTRTLPSRDHRLVCHVGQPVRATCRADNRTHHRLQSRGDIDVIPAGIPGVWEDDGASAVLLISLSPELLAAAATRAGVCDDRGEVDGAP